MDYTLKDILSTELAPALGCTEPVAVALAAAAAASLVRPAAVESLSVVVDPNIFKNGMGVAIPGTGGEHGLHLAAALGAVCGDYARGLEVLDGFGPEHLASAHGLIAEERVRLAPRTERGLYAEVLIAAGGRTARAVVQGRHDNLVLLEVEGEAVAQSGREQARPRRDASGPGEALGRAGFGELLALLDELDDEDFAFLDQGVRMNLALAEHGLTHGGGLAVGRTLEGLAEQGLVGRDMAHAARTLTSAAADARLSGAPLPAMSCAGSGTVGLGAVLAVWAVAEHQGIGGAKPRLRAVCLSHLVTIAVKARMGRLSAMCGCAVAAGAGAAAGITRLLGGGPEAVAGAVANVAADLAGVICDGAKAGCALKLSSAASSAVQAALFALEGAVVRPGQGIVGQSVESTMDNLGRVGREGMAATDATILDIMRAGCAS